MFGADVDDTERAAGMDRSPETGPRNRCGCCVREPTRTTSRRWKSRGPCTRRSRGDTNARIDDHFDSSRSRIRSFRGDARGILFINPERLTRVLNVDLLGRRTLIPLLAVPACAGRRRGRARVGAPSSIPMRSHGLHGPRRAPCGARAAALLCADAPRVGAGDPLNVVLVGELADIGGAGAPQLSARRASRGHGAAGLRPRARRRAAQAGASGCALDLDAPVARPMRFEGGPSTSCRSDGRWAGASCLAARAPSSCMRTWTRRETSWSRT